MTKLTFRTIHFTKANLYVAMAWNYDQAIMVTTEPATSKNCAIRNLNKYCKARNFILNYFDGPYTCAGQGDVLLPADSELTPMGVITEDENVVFVIWDTDQNSPELPSYVRVPKETEDIPEYLSDKYASLIKSYYIK